MGETIKKNNRMNNFKTKKLASSQKLAILYL